MKNNSKRYQLRLATEADISALQEIERSASILFADSLYPELSTGSVIASETYKYHLGAGHKIMMAVGHDEANRQNPVGFAFTAPLGDGLHLYELSVRADHQRQGVGSLLLNAVIDHARSETYAHISLTTYRSIVWNGPFYCKHGFHEPDPDALSADLASILSREIKKGANARDRCAMLHVIR